MIRGWKTTPWHNDILEKFINDEIFDVPKHLKSKWGVKVIGGGFIKHTYRPDKKKIYIYGSSHTYGTADHELSKSLIEKEYTQHRVKCSKITKDGLKVMWNPKYSNEERAKG